MVNGRTSLRIRAYLETGLFSTHSAEADHKFLSGYRGFSKLFVQESALRGMLHRNPFGTTFFRKTYLRLW